MGGLCGAQQAGGRAVEAGKDWERAQCDARLVLASGPRWARLTLDETGGGVTAVVVARSADLSEHESNARSTNALWSVDESVGKEGHSKFGVHPKFESQSWLTQLAGLMAPCSMTVAWGRSAPISQLIGLAEPSGQ